MDPRAARTTPVDPRTSLALWLRAARAQKQLTLDDVARVTKIQPRILEKLETGQLEGLPAEVFVRGFVKSFARAVGLDEGEASERYTSCAALGPSDKAAMPAARAFVETLVAAPPRQAAKPAAAAATAAPPIGTAMAIGSAPIATAPTAPIAVAPAPISTAPIATTIDTAPTAPIVTVPVDAAAPIATAATEDESEAKPKAKRTRKKSTTASTAPRTRKKKSTANLDAAASDAGASASIAATDASATASTATDSRDTATDSSASDSSAVLVSASDSSGSAQANIATDSTENAATAFDATLPPVEPPNAIVRDSHIDLAAGSLAIEAKLDATPVESVEIALAQGSEPVAQPVEVTETTETAWQPQMPPASSTTTSTMPWKRPTYATYVAPTLVIDDADPESAERERAERDAEASGKGRVSFLPPILLDREDKSGRQGGLTLAVIILLIAATLTLSYLMRRPSATGDGVTLNAQANPTFVA